MRSIVAATALAVVTCIMGVGMLLGAGQAQAYCPMDQRCPEIENAPVGISPDVARDLEESFYRIVHDMDERTRQVAGVPSYR